MEFVGFIIVSPAVEKKTRYQVLASFVHRFYRYDMKEICLFIFVSLYPQKNNYVYYQIFLILFSKELLFYVFCCIMILGIKSFLFAANLLSSKFCKIYFIFLPLSKKNLNIPFLCVLAKRNKQDGMIVLYLWAQLAVLYTYNCLLILIYYRLGQNQLIINKYAV